ncbi:MAG TPA: hypothetical protein VF181_03755 [Balneolaceae bacterium]
MKGLSKGIPSGKPTSRKHSEFGGRHSYFQATRPLPPALKNLFARVEGLEPHIRRLADLENYLPGSGLQNRTASPTLPNCTGGRT